MADAAFMLMAFYAAHRLGYRILCPPRLHEGTATGWEYHRPAALHMLTGETSHHHLSCNATAAMQNIFFFLVKRESAKRLTAWGAEGLDGVIRGVPRWSGGVGGGNLWCLVRH
jgi:hypothetical protein